MSQRRYWALAVRVALLAGLMASSAGYTLSADWVHYRGGTGGGVSSETLGLPDSGGYPVLWRAKVGIGTSSFVVQSDRLYTMGHEGDADYILCLDTHSGGVLWKYRQPATLDPNLFEGGSRSTPTLHGNLLYAISHDGQAVCLNASTGALLWQRHLVQHFGGKKPEWGYSGAPLVNGDQVVFDIGAAGGSTLALNAKTGEVVWKNGSEPAGYASPLIFTLAGRRTLVVFKADCIVGLDPENGNPFWRHPWKTSYKVNAATPIQVSPDRLLLSSGYNEGASVLEMSGGNVREVWRNKNLRAHINSPVCLANLIFGIDGNTGGGNLVCLDSTTGERMWEEKSVKGGALILASGKLLIVSEKGDFVVAEASGKGFKQLSRQSVLGQRTWAQPVLSNGRIFLRDNLGNLACLGAQ